MKNKLTTKELSKRWNKSEGTLRNWRYKKIGPKYIKLIGTVYYSISEIKKFEQSL